MIRTFHLVGRGASQRTYRALSFAHPRSIFVGILSLTGLAAAALATAQDTARPLAIDAKERTPAFSRAFVGEAISITDSGDDASGDVNGRTAMPARGEPTITVTSPNGGEIWQAGTTQTITWDSVNPTGVVNIQLVTSGGSGGYIASVPMASGQLNWDICPNVGNGVDYTIRIEWCPEYPCVTDESDAPFEITDSLPRPTLILTSPNGGEVFQAGTSRLITWTSTNPSGSVRAHLRRGGVWVGILGWAPMADGQMSWDICAAIGDGSDYTIGIEACECGVCVTDQSDSPFEIVGSLPRPTLALTSPNAGEVWEAGTTQTVTWDSTNPTGDVSIRLYKDGNYYQHLGTAPISDGSFVWDICPYTGDGPNYTIEIRACGCVPCVNDESDAAFEITGSLTQPTLTLTSPNGGEVWEPGTTQTVTWDSTNTTGDVLIRLYKDGDYYNQLGYVPMGDGSFAWEVCPYTGDGSDLTVRLSWSEDCGYVEDYSDAPFEITGSLPLPALTLTSPNGGEAWEAGTTHTVRWDSTDATGDVYIRLYRDGDYYQHLGHVPIGDGSFAWHICNDIGDGNDYTIRITWCDCGPCVTDDSEAAFEITGSLTQPTLTLTSPNGGEVWDAGATQTVTWDSTNPTGNVSIRLYKDGVSYQDLGYALMGDGSFVWEICPYTEDGSDYTVRLSWSGGCRSVEDYSDAPLEITSSLPRPTLTLTSPNGSEVWEAGTTQTVTWNSTNPTGDVSIRLYKDGNSYQHLGSAPMADGQLIWDICPYIGDGADYTIRIEWCDCGPCVTDDSDAAFEITGSLPLSTLTLTSPNGGEVWDAGTTQTVTWDSTNPMGYVSFILYRDGNYYQEVGYALMGDGSFAWDICPYLGDGDGYTIRIEWCDCGPCVADDSDAPFEITGSLPQPILTLTSPNGGNVWRAGTTQTITWESTTPTGDVLIRLYKDGDYYNQLGYVPMGDGSFAWEICPYTGDGTDYTVRISWSEDCGYVEDYSDAPFEIAGSLPQPTLTLISPNDGDVWEAGTTQTIAWTSSTSEGYVDIYAVTGSDESLWIDQVPVSDGSVTWNICSSIGDGADYTIHLSWWLEGCGYVEDYGIAPFEITGSSPRPTLTLTSPNGDEVWEAGTTQTITWNSTNPTGDVSIRLYKDGNSHQHLGYVPMTDGQLIWDICPYIGDGADYTIRIAWCDCGPCVTDDSDAPFEIMNSTTAPTFMLTSPNGGEVWDAGATQTVTWDSTNPTGGVYVRLYKDGNYYEHLGYVPMTDGQLIWDICPYIGDGADYTIRIEWYDCGPCVTDESDAPFGIIGSVPVPTLTVTSPVASTVWQAGTPQTISWTTDATEGYVDVTLFEGEQWRNRIRWIPASAGSTYWNISSIVGDGTDYTIRLSLSTDCGPSVEVVSDSFEIWGSLPAVACCSDYGCSMTSVDECTDNYCGISLGLDSTCETDACPTRSCCLPNGTCADMLYDDCAAVGGESGNLESDCLSATCEPFEACCSSYNCSDMQPATCTTVYYDPRIPLGPGTSCETTPCPPQACCHADGSCSMLDEDICWESFGGPMGQGSDCESASCEPFQACCFEDGQCGDGPPNMCTLNGYFPQGIGTTCESAICPIEACCSADGGCSDMTANMCTLYGRIPQGAGTTCATATCAVEACCSADGDCSDFMPDACTSYGRIPQGAGTTCSEATCSVEACCVDDNLFGPFGDSPGSPGTVFSPTNGCADILPDSCIAAGGLPHGPGTECETSSCPDRACCMPDGSCTNLQPDACEASGGLSRDHDLTCSTTTCLPFESCCGDGALFPQTQQTNSIASTLPVGLAGVVDVARVPGSEGCVNAPPDLCSESGFVPGGPGSDCSISGCAYEACCTMNGCVDALAPFCRVELNGAPLGIGTDCNTTTCPDVAYCSSDGTCYNVEDPAPPNAGCQPNTDWPAGVIEDCSTDPCEPFEACCTALGCFDTTPSFCESGAGPAFMTGFFPGIPQGADTSCAAGSCPSTACCSAAGGCADEFAEYCYGGTQWQISLGIPGETCESYTCQPYEACCYFGGCIELEPSICTAVGGFPQGKGATCMSTRCIREVRGDLDDDGRATLEDWSILAACFAGPAIRTPPAGCNLQDFEVADIDGDGDVDMADYRKFAIGFAGPG